MVHTLSEIEAFVVLNNLFIQSRVGMRLLQQEGSARAALETIPGWERESSWQEELRVLEKGEVGLLCYGAPDYPEPLYALSDPPLLLYCKGVLPKDPMLLIVGTRTCTLYGSATAESFASVLAQQGIPILSGLARGIDTAAHRGALAGKGRTVAILGSGLDNLYPRENSAFAKRIVAEGGALLSEVPLQTPPRKDLFPKRNRLLAELAHAVLLIESPLKGGSMITVECAAGKPLYALPGRVDMPTFEGNHALLKEQRATLLERPEELLPLFGKGLCSPRSLGLDLDEEEQAFFSQLPKEERSIEELVLLTQLPVMKLNTLLMRLVFKNAVKEYPGKIYKKIYG